MKKVFVFAVLLFSIFSAASAEIKVISPIEGTWANKQMLVIDTSDGADYFYSLNGSDPTVEGFAYDGPVLIDMTGRITVRISKGFSENKDISFYVNPEYPSSNAEKMFVYSFFDTGIINYSSGAEIQIPDSMKYSFEQIPESYISGRTLKYSESCSLSRFIPCTVTNGKLSWHFVIRTNPKAGGTYSRRDLPITVTDWNTISFNDKNLIYRIDNNLWALPKNDVTIDRSVSHIIYWQSIAYETGNPIEFIELPPKPDLQKTINDDGSITFSFDGDDSYSMCFVSSDITYQELFTELCADTFYGDYLDANKQVAVYSDSFYQGLIDVNYLIDKRVAPSPEFIPSVAGFHVHGILGLNVKVASNAELYISVSNPLIINESEESYSADANIFKDVRADDFTKTGSKINLVLEPMDGVSVFYKIRAFSKLGSAVSDFEEYNVIINNYDFYFDSDADSSIADGSPEHPFVSFSQGYNTIRGYRTVNIYISGDVMLPEGKTEMLFNCKINGLRNANLVFPKGSSLVVKNSTLQIKNCRVSSDNSSLGRNAPASLIKLENSVLDIDGGEIAATGAKNNTVIDSYNSVITLHNSIFSVTATTYSSLVSANNTYIDVSSCKIGIVGDTAVAFSVRGSDFIMQETSVRLTGTIGRVAELFGVSAKVRKNEFSADLKNNNGTIDSIYCDKNSKLEESDLYILGF